ncbi:MAG: DUF3108 domain-containing protein [Methylophilaceae bacterium]
MLKLIKPLFLYCLLLTSIAFAQPNNIQLEYEVSRNGKAFGTVKESYTQEGDKYRIVSTTKGKGIYALLGKRVLTSNGDVTAKGLKPAKFHLKRGDSKRKSLTANFDWANNTLNMLVKGETRTAKLVTGTQDLASYAYQFMFTPPKGDQVKLSLTTGKKLKQYTYHVKQGATIKTAGNNYKTIHLVNAEVDGKKKKELWLAKVKSDYCLPVKYLVIDKHGDKLEQTLTKISIQ